MLVHECTECKTFSINRIAADDDSGTVMSVFEESRVLGHQVQALCQEYSIMMLRTEDIKLVYTQLYGHQAETPMIPWT